MLRSLFTLAAVAALTLSPWLARPALGAPADPGIEAETIRVDAPPAETRPAEPAPLVTTPDWKGLRRDTWYFLGYQVVGVAVLYALPEDVTNFSKEGDYLGQWRSNVSNPVWDDDSNFVNYVTHPYWGATYYIRGRERGLSRWESLGYSALLSTLYEYGAEALFERPSYQDLIVTPLIGSLIGEYVFSPWRAYIKSKPGGTNTLDKVVLIFTDPLGAANDLTNRLFGVETQVSLAPMRVTTLSKSALPAGSGAGGHRADRDRRRPPSWGLQLDVRW